MALGLPSHLRATAAELLAGSSSSLAVIAASIFAQRLVLPLSVLWLGEGDQAIAGAALVGAALLGFVRARAADRLARAVRLNLLELHLRPFERGSAASLPSSEAVTARFSNALPVLVSWAVDGVAVALAAAAAVPAVTALLARALGASVLLPLGAAGLVGAAVTMGTSRSVDAAWAAAWERSRALVERAGAGFAGAVDLRANGRAAAFAEELRGAARTWSAAEGRARVVSTVSTWGALGGTLAAWAGVSAALGRGLGSGGDVFKSSLLIVAAIPTLQTLISGVASLLYARDELEAAARQREIAREVGAEEIDEEIDATAEIRLEEIGYAYPGGGGEGVPTVALEDVTLVLPRGGSVAITGPNGAGKTTLLHVLLGVARPDRGRVLVGGREARLDNRRFRERVSFLAQRPFELTGGTIGENLRAFDPRVEEARLIEALDQVGLRDALRARAANDAALLGLPYAALSRGQMRRLMLARALLRDADLLVLDEPEAHLDEASVGELAELLARIARDRRVVAVIHDRALAGFAGRVIDLAPPGAARAEDPRPHTAAAALR